MGGLAAGGDADGTAARFALVGLACATKQLAWPFAPFLFLALLTSTLQALVFTVLSTIYFLLMLPHDDHGHERGERRCGRRQRLRRS